MKKAELVLIPAPAVGHLVSILEFAKRLIDRDHRISFTILAIKSAFPSSSDSYIRSVIASQPRIKLIDVPQVDPPAKELLRSPVKYFSTYIQSHTPHVNNIISDIISSNNSDNSNRVVGLVVDFFCVSMVDVAQQLNLPSYLFMTSNAGGLSLMLYLPILHDQKLDAEIYYRDHDLVVPGIAKSIPPNVLPSAFTDGGYADYIEIARKFREARGIIVNTFEELEPFAVNWLSSGPAQAPLVYTVGPVLDLQGGSKAHTSLDQDDHDKIIHWLDDQPPLSVVFLCFGSMGSFDEAQVKEIAFGLERSEQRFLWSLRVQQYPKEGDPVGLFLPDGFLERIKGRGMVCGWAPQVEVLAHKSTGGFVSHCGWNSILESLWNGVPIVTWPLYAEQPMNAFRMARELGMAEELRVDYRRGGNVGDLVMADEIEKAVRDVMEKESEVRKKVKEMGELARKAVMEGGSSFNSTGRFIEDMIGKE
ncbi:UDP-glycosyltransferase 71K1-like [Ziziphus jujuba]|uniref:Glycosyltransferase n=1 Tax=Ziziphus jujuba TaxID=326968 RepID=A0A6P3Z7E8_ZIZJJ|nr:UDP-glycosyltransferase 71K1-like [Ziziphus jujuba]